MRKETLVIMSLLVIGLMVASAVPIGAAKGGNPGKPDDGGDDDGGGGDPTGTIYYLVRDDVDGFSYWNMDADGSNKAEFSDSWPGSLSLNQHDGSYWFVYFKELTTTHYGDIYQTELWAERADGTEDPCYLWSDPSMVYMDWNGPICWMTGDAHLSWVTWKVDANGAISDQGIYQAELSWGTNDDTPSIVGNPWKVYDTGTYQYAEGDVRSDGTSPNWSTDGNMVLYNKVGTGRVLVDLSVDPDDPDEISIGYSGEAAISPDGTMIAVASGSKSLIVMDIDGSNAQTIDSVKSTKYLWRYIQFIHWSPDSAYIAYGSLTINWPDMDCDVYTIGVDGTGKEQLTKKTTTCDWQVPLEWR